MTETEKDSSARVRNITFFSIFIMLIFTCIVVGQLSRASRTAQHQAVVNDSRLLHIMSQQMELSFIAVDNSLHRAIEHQYYNEKFLSNSPEYILHDIQEMVEESPRLAAIVLVDENGQAIVAANKKIHHEWLDYTHHSFANDEVFKQLRAGDDNERFIGKLHNAKKNVSDFVIVGRKIKHPDGSFGGVFVAALDPIFFVKYFHMLEQGPESYLSLQMINSGELLVDSGITTTYNEELNALAITEYKSGAGDKSDISVKTYKLGKAKEIYGFVKLSSLPLLVTITLDENDYLKAWRDNSFKDLCFLMVFIVFGSLLSFFAITMAQQIARVEKSEAAAVLASQAKSEFLANMSHELRTPLNAIIGFSEMMNSGYFGQLNAKQKERIHDINLCGSHLLNLITDILEFSKGDAGKLELVEERVIMNDIVSETMRMMNKKIKEKQMNMLVEVDPELPDILGDKRKIRQILLNLLSNSIKFTPELGTIKISVQQDANKNVTMTVSDTGIGIAEKDIPVALSVFGQAHRNQSHEGTGLGLPLCKMFAELHGGRLAFGSTLGEGTTVRITFPATRNIEKGDSSVPANAA